MFLRCLTFPFKIELTTDLGEVHPVRLVTYALAQKGGGSNPDRGIWTITCQLFDELFRGLD
jgi:hypothetical protein